MHRTNLFAILAATLLLSAVFAGTAIFFGAPAASSRPRMPVAIDTDERPGAYADPRLTLARIQSDMERVSIGRPRWTLPTGQRRDPTEIMVDAYAAYLHGKIRTMDALLTSISIEQHVADPYFEKLDALSAKPALVRLIIGMRRIDSTLIVAMDRVGSTDMGTRDASLLLALASSQPNDSWLRLPCRTIIGRAGEFDHAAKILGQLSGPLLSCPMDASVGYARLEQQAKTPESLAVKVEATPAPVTQPKAPETPPPPPWSRDTAVAFMDRNPALAGPVLEAASHIDAVGALDYALYLHSFQPASPERNATIASLLAEITAKSSGISDDTPNLAPYDGSDESIVPFIEFASQYGDAQTAPRFYAVPCSILMARPALIEAIKPEYGSNRDNFLPRSGCSWGRGTVSNFPDDDVREFAAAAEEADGHFIDNYGGSLRYGLMSEQNATLETIRLDPRSFLELPVPPGNYPYQDWGMTSLNNYAVSLNLKVKFEQAHRSLVAYFIKRDLTSAESDKAAKTALFDLVWGANCRTGKIGSALRPLLLEGADASEIQNVITRDGLADGDFTSSCVEFAGRDPLLHVAVGNPVALPLILQETPDINLRNPIGKTALMVAAQFDQVDSARLLLDRGARVDATTWQSSSDDVTLSHDGRSALMYAAARGSLAMIKLLLAAGADPDQADTKGDRAIDYLLGFGPTPPNTKLSQEQRAEAARLLF